MKWNKTKGLTLILTLALININCESNENLSREKIQEFLDEGMSPKYILDNGASLDEFYGLTYQGGFIFYLDANFGNGMIAAVEDATDRMSWHDAKSYCENLSIEGNDDWNLPKMEHLTLMWLNLADSDGDGYCYGPNDPFNLGGFESEYYHSSTEQDLEDSRSLDFYDSLESIGPKNWNYYVRAIRSF